MPLQDTLEACSAYSGAGASELRVQAMTRDGMSVDLGHIDTGRSVKAAPLPADDTHERRAHSSPPALGGRRGAGAATAARCRSPDEELDMDKWRILQNSTVVRGSASAATLVAAAALVGAGWKW